MTTTAITTLRLRTRDGDSAALRLRAARALQAADVTPAALPPAAILVVRRVEDPMPGAFGGDRLRPPAAWESAVRETLSRAARAAARPDRRGWIAPDADAVIFAEEAELLAWVLAACARGQASRWWWRAVVRRLGVAALAAQHPDRIDLASLLGARPREAPAACAHLHRWDQVAAIAPRMSILGAASALSSLASTHALSERIVSPPPLKMTVDRRGPDAGFAATIDAAAPPLADGEARRPRAPWSDWLPPALDDDEIAPEIQCLIGVALCLFAAPSRLRSASAAAQASRWWRGAAPLTIGDAASFAAGVSFPPAPARDRGDDATSRGAAASQSRAIADPRAATNANDDDSQPPALLIETRMAPAAQLAPAPDSRDGRAVAAIPSHASGARDENSPAAPAEGAAAPGAADSTGSARGASRPQATASQEQPVAADAARAAAPDVAFRSEEIPTRLGGILYLIHALEGLGLPGAFEPAWRLPAASAPWGAIDLVARALLGREFDTFARDPLWRTLADLAGWTGRVRDTRKESPPVAPRHAVSDPPYAVPAAWPSSLADAGDRFEWATHAARLWVWSSEGYLVAHRRHTAHPSAVAVRECARYAASGPQRVVRGRAGAMPWRPPVELPAGCPARLGRWAAATAPAVARRLQLAIGPGAAACERDRAVASCLAVRGRLYVTSSHIDLVVALDDVDVTLRRAGLDRDPGWLPAYGRVVYFHFE